MDFDYNRPSLELVFDLIVSANGTALQKADVVFGTPQAFIPFESDPHKRNTRVVASAMLSETSRLRGKVTLSYRRLDLEDFVPEFEDQQVSVTSLPFTAYQILEQINARYGLALEESDIVDAVYTQLAERYAIAADARSLAWIGELSIETTYREVTLSEIIRVTMLNGLHYYVPGASLAACTPVTDLAGFTAEDLLFACPVTDLDGFEAA